MHRLACALCGALLAAGFAAAAHADPVTYTWVTQSETSPDPYSIPELAFAFTVDGPISVDANSDFANNGEFNPPPTAVQYPFPSTLVAFDLHVGFLSVMPSDFTSPDPNRNFFPKWDLTLEANPSNLTASIDLFFINAPNGNDEIAGPMQFTPANASTAATSTIYYYSDGFGTDAYTGMLVATNAVPEPGSLLLLSVGLGIMVIGAGWRRGLVLHIPPL